MLTWIKSALRRTLDAPRAREERATLRQLCFGDDAAVTRLIAAEHARRPGLSELEACRRAVQSIRRDKR